MFQKMLHEKAVANVLSTFVDSFIGLKVEENTTELLTQLFLISN